MESFDKSQKHCEICRKAASCLCYECFMYFCDSCYKIAHELLLDGKHKKEKIDYFISVETKCPTHPKVPINLFCIDDKGK